MRTKEQRNVLHHGKGHVLESGWKELVYISGDQQTADSRTIL